MTEEVIHEPEEVIAAPEAIEATPDVEAIKEEPVAEESPAVEVAAEVIDEFTEFAVSLGWDPERAKQPGGKTKQQFIKDYGAIHKNKNKALEQSIEALKQTLIETETEKLIAYQKNIDTAISDMIKAGTINSESYEQLIKEKSTVNDQIAKITQKFQQSTVNEKAVIVREFGFKNRAMLQDESVLKWAQTRIDYLTTLDTNRSIEDVLDQLQGELNTKCGIRTIEAKKEEPSRTLSSTPTGKNVNKNPTEKDLYPEHLDLYENFYKRNGKITNVSDFVKHMRATSKGTKVEFKLKGE